MNVKKMSTTEIVNKLHKMTDVPVAAIAQMSREDLVIHLTDLLNGDTDAPDFYNAVMGTNNDTVAQTFEAVTEVMDTLEPEVVKAVLQGIKAHIDTLQPETDEVLPDDCIAKADAPVVNRTKFEDPKLRKAYRTKCRAIANKLNVAWQQTPEGDYIVDGKLYTFADFVANHNK